LRGHDAQAFLVSGRHLQGGQDAILRRWLGDWRVEWIEFRNPNTTARTIQRARVLFPEADVSVADPVEIAADGDWMAGE